MSHEITIRHDGSAEAAYALTPAWHGLGTVVQHTMTSQEAIILAQLDWSVKQVPIFARVPPEPGSPQDFVDYRIKNRWANIRTDTDAILGMVGGTYKVIQNRDAFDFVDSLHQDGIIKYESAGSLKGGKIVWLLARMPEEFMLASGDTQRKYILFSTSHDGSGTIRCLPTSVRVVCWNTYTIATKRENYGLKIKHWGDIKSKLTLARNIMRGIDSQFNAYHDDASRLIEKKIDERMVEVYVNALMPDTESSNNAHRRAMREQVIRAFRESPQMLPSIRDTAWAAFNAVTQVTDHNATYRARNSTKAENRMMSTMFGSNAKLKRAAFALAKTMWL